jgi:WD40 repeat protein
MKILNNHRRLIVLTTLLGMALLLPACSKPTTSSQPEHVRGAIQTVDGQVLTVGTSDGSVRVRLAPSTAIATVVQSDRAHLTDGSFLGITSVAGPDGSRRAVEVHVFPEAMRGTGEGSRGWDWPGASGNSKMTNGTASSMTNGTVSNSKMTNGTVTAQHGGSSLTLQYKDGASGGSQTITIPPGIPVVAIEPGQSSDLQPGAHVFVLATHDSAGVLTADRVLAGKNGVVPPM